MKHSKIHAHMKSQTLVMHVGNVGMLICHFLAHFLACFVTITISIMNRFYYLDHLFLHVAFLLVWTVRFWIMDCFCLGLASYQSWTMCVELVWLDNTKIKLRLNLATNNTHVSMMLTSSASR